MLSIKSALAFLLVLITSAASQVVVTETDTVTLVTITSVITVAPPSTSTTTAYVTVGGNPPSTTSYYSTEYVTVTAGQSAPSSNSVCPVEHHGQCGGTNYSGCRDCAYRHYCSKVNDGYSICHLAYTVATAVATVYKGDAL
ncbi:hypothetical protein V8E51_007212 [Hyaloscypha variabilis]